MDFLIYLIIIVAVVVAYKLHRESVEKEKQELLAYYEDHLNKHKDEVWRKHLCPFCEIDKDKIK